MLQKVRGDVAQTVGSDSSQQQPAAGAPWRKKNLTVPSGDSLQRDRYQQRLDANALELFARVARAGSFAAAGRDLGLTRAAVSSRVAAIEALIGRPLFVRHSRALGLTETGRALIASAQAVLGAADTARRELRMRAEPDVHPGLQGCLRISACPSYGQGVLAPRLALFQALHPQLKIELQFSNRVVDLARDNFDIAFRMTPRPPEDCVATPVLHFDIRAWAAPGRMPALVAPADLARHNCLVWGASTESITLQWRRGDAGVSEAVTLSPSLCIDDLRALVDLAVAGRGIVFAPAFAVAEQVERNALAEVLPGWTAQVDLGDAVVALTLAHGVVPPAARVLVDFVRAPLAGS